MPLSLDEAGRILEQKILISRTIRALHSVLVEIEFEENEDKIIVAAATNILQKISRSLEDKLT